MSAVAAGTDEQMAGVVGRIQWVIICSSLAAFTPLVLSVDHFIAHRHSYSLSVWSLQCFRGCCLNGLFSIDQSCPSPSLEVVSVSCQLYGNACIVLFVLVLSAERIGSDSSLLLYSRYFCGWSWHLLVVSSIVGASCGCSQCQYIYLAVFTEAAVDVSILWVTLNYSLFPPVLIG